MRILITTLLHPLPTNIARGTFVSDHVELLKSIGHDVRVINPLPRLLKYQESSRSTLTGVAKASKEFTHGQTKVYVPRFWGLPNHPYPSITIGSMKRITGKVLRWLGDWQPDLLISHTLWPVGELANRLSKKLDIPWVGVVHGHDFDVGLKDNNLGKQIIRLSNACQHLVTVSTRLGDIAKEVKGNHYSVIACHNSVGQEWLKKPKIWRGRWRKDKLDILFPSDPRRPEKNHYLALLTGEELEKRGWIVGLTTLKQQPRSIVWDRMLVADLTLITSKRESGPLVARESLLCGTPVISVNVGEVEQYLPATCVVDDYDPILLADACEAALADNWAEGFSIPEKYTSEYVKNQWISLLSSLLE